ncbi:SRSF2 [Symbiodinium pilosum]|uniref:SRSF2 protein n=1 Tax=Symbiodinium pilosum TaxID=2952 RepID=A0A812W7R7_SYMPI|nr:SRSF2 [Symbiodinium pilosum]
MANLIPDDVEQMHSVKIDYVSTRVEKEDLEKLFGKYGRVGDVYLPSHPNGDRKGFAFVRFYNKQDAEDAVKEMEGYELEGKTLKCMLATVQKGRFNPNVRRNPPRSRSRSRRGRRDSRGRSRRRDDSRDRRDSRTRRRSPRRDSRPRQPPRRDDSRDSYRRR